jgi:hypothetical protein
VKAVPKLPATLQCSQAVHLEISVSSSVTILAPANFPIGNFPSVVNAVNRVRIRISIGNFPSVVNAVNRVRIRISICSFLFVIFWSFE